MNIDQVGAVVLVGAGQMGLAMARGWMKAGLKAANLTLVDPTPRQTSRDFAATHNIDLVASVPEQPAGVLVLAVKPQVVEQVMAGINPRIGPETLTMSVVAGIALARLYRGLGSRRVVRAMPNTPAQLGMGVTGAIAGSALSEKNRTAADVLLSASGLVLWLENESEMDALTAVSGAGPDVFLLVEAMAAAGVAEGLPEETAMILARQTIIGAAALMQADPAPAQTLRQNVTSPNGVTAEALSVLMARPGLGELMARAIAAATRRSTELGG